MASSAFACNIDGNTISYALIEELGHGAFARAELCDSQRRVVLKRVKLNKKVIRANEKVRRLVENEAKVLAILCHPYIVRIWNTWHDNVLNEIVMELEYCGGGSLKDAVDETKEAARQLGQGIVKIWLAQLALGISYLHDIGIVHRDLKTDNVLLTTDKSVIKIADFGTAKLVNSADPTLTGAIGTVTYMAPEILVGDGSQKSQPKVDVWAYGIIAFELATLDLPFNPNDKSYNPFLGMTLLFSNNRELNGIERVEQFHSTALRQLIEKKLLVYDLGKRATIEQALKDEYFQGEATNLLQDYNNYLHYQIKQQSVQLAQAAGSKARLDESIKQMQTQLQQNQADNAKLKEQLQQEESSNAVLRAAFSSMATAKDALQSEHNTVKSQFSQLQSKFGDMELQLKQSEESKAALQTAFSSMATAKYALQSEINTVKSQYSQLQSKLAHMELQLKGQKLDEQVDDSEQEEPIVVDQNKQKEFFIASYAGDLRRVKSLLATRQVDVNGKYNAWIHGVIEGQYWTEGDTALTNAAWKGHQEVVRLLLKHGANVNEKNQYGNSVLMFAADSGQPEIVELLLKEGANVDERNQHGSTALSSTLRPEVKALLKEYGAKE